MSGRKKQAIPSPHNSIGVTGSGPTLRYWAHLFRNMHIEREAGPFLTLDAAAAAFLPVKVWPKLQPPPRG